MVTEQDPFVGGDVIFAVVVHFCRCFSLVIQFKYFSGQEPAVKTIGDSVGADRGHQQPDSVDRLPLERARMPKAAAPAADTTAQMRYEIHFFNGKLLQSMNQVK